VALLVISFGMVYGQVGTSLIYDITTIDFVSTSVDTIVYIRTPAEITSISGDAAYDKAEVKGETFYLYAFYFKSTGQLKMRDANGNGMLITVTNPEEQVQAQDYASNLEACRAKVAMLEPMVSELRNRTETLESNLTYYKRIVEENRTIVKVKYVLGEDEWLNATRKWREEMSFTEIGRMYLGHLFVIYLFGVFSAVTVISILRKFRFDSLA